MITLERQLNHPITAYHRFKPVLDFLGAAILVILFAPLLLLVALIIRLDSPGPAIYRQTRIGMNGQPFTIFKFRTMKVDAPVLSTEEMQKCGIIPFTRIGPFLRKTSLDELPQLFNILKGEMSFIGPRPALPSQTDVNTLRAERRADSVRPGITGLAQVMGRDDLDVETKVTYDAEYCENISFRSDLQILVGTFYAVSTARGNK